MGPTHPLSSPRNNALRKRTPLLPLPLQTLQTPPFTFAGTPSAIPQHLHLRSRDSLRRLPSRHNPNQTPRRTPLVLPRPLRARLLHRALGRRGAHLVLRADYICASADRAVGMGVGYVG